MELTKISLADRLFSKVKVNAETGCWNWTAFKGHNGYGILKVGGRSGKSMRAHRLSYEVHRGPVGDGVYVCHRCDNRACINPEHLFLGSHADNMSDMLKKNRQTRRRGTTNHNSKLNDADVLAIREAGDITQQTLAEQYGVSQSLISLIRADILWTHVDISQRSLLA